MSKNKNILILNTGGTFNKIYNEISGRLTVSLENKAIDDILLNSKINHFEVKGLIYKDSLEMSKQDRLLIKKYIEKSPYDKIIIVHGTDTMDKTAKFLSKHIKNKTIVLTGAMVPYSIEKIEATSNLMLAVGYIQTIKEDNIYIAMHGNVKKYNKIKKNRTMGIFECQK